MDVEDDAVQDEKTAAMKAMLGPSLNVGSAMQSMDLFCHMCSGSTSRLICAALDPNSESHNCKCR